MHKVWEFIRKQKAKAKLIKAFHAAGIYKTYKSGENTGYIYPKVVNVVFQEDKTEFVFVSLPGITPKDIEEKEVVFKQVLGRNTEIKHDNVKKCVVSVYKNTLPHSFKYDFDEIVTEIENMTLPFICGIDINGQFIAFDLAEEAHCLLSSETGGGKSSLLRAVITTLIQLKDPSELEMYLGDLKRSEFGIFRNKRCVKGVYTSAKKLLPALSKIKKEMEKRGDLLDQYEMNHIDELPFKLPRILVCIDEVALLKKEKDIMDIIEDISSIGRALGVHLILSMQRPDSNVLESGALKNNLRVRISGRQSNAMNAKVAGVPGVEKIGIDQRGRMKIKLDDVTEFQAPFLSGAEAKKILKQYHIESSNDENHQEEVEQKQQEQPTAEDILGVIK
jgi:DNA segregation ATPase FtsK/SpoIIIE, S-DNA-T family